ncbi:MAG: hypothetical protein QM775_28535 [Pirellulales bacterium]
MNTMDGSKDESASPGFSALAQGWSRTRLTKVEPLDPRLDALARALLATNNMHGVSLVQLKVHPDPEIADYFAHNRIDADFFPYFFRHPDVLGVLGLLPGRETLGFSRATGAQTLEMLARAILMGGAYRPFRGTERDARRLATDFATAIGPRFATAGAWVSDTPWSGWFRDVAWDRSFFWYDRGTGIATVLLTTDTD